jgi:Ca2+-binding EF-hand superfamily protein
MMNAVGVDIPSDEELRIYFDSFDKDHNGFIIADEILYGSAVRSGKPITIEVAKQIICNIDSNGDGKTSFEEFHKYVDALLELFY